MNRRGFLKLLLPAAGAVVVAPELLSEIWTPSRTYFLPPRGGWRSLILTGEIGRYENIRIANQPWAVNTLGGYYYPNQLSEVLRQSIQPLVRFRTLPDVRPPQRFSWNVYPDTVGS